MFSSAKGLLGMWGPSGLPLNGSPGALFPGAEQLGLMRAARHLVPRLIVNGAIPALPPCAFMAFTGTTVILLKHFITIVLSTSVSFEYFYRFFPLKSCSSFSQFSYKV